MVAIASSGYHCLALLADGSVVAWGENESGQLGDGTRAYRRRPVAVSGVSGAVGVSAAGMISLALLEDGSVLGWGSNVDGAFGGGPDRLLPGPVAGLERDVVEVWAGSPMVAVTRDGRVVAVGSGAGEGLGWAPVPIVVPQPGLRPGGWSGRVAVLRDGTAVSWPGWRLGPAPPHRLEQVRDAVAVAGGGRELVVLRQDGSVSTLTLEPGQAPTGSSSPGKLSVVTGLGQSVKAIASGSGCTFALKEDGSVWAWGWGYKGQLGDGSDRTHDLPIPVAGLEVGVRAIAHKMALKEDGSVWTWGGDVVEMVDADLAVGASKLGGAPDVSDGTRWPSYDGRLLSFVGQVNLADVSPFDEQDMLPPAGLVSFFYDLLQNPRGALASAVGFWEDVGSLSRALVPDELSHHQWTPPVPISPEEDFCLHPLPPAWLTDEERSVYCLAPTFASGPDAS